MTTSNNNSSFSSCLSFITRLDPPELTFHLLLRPQLPVTPQRWGRCQLQLTVAVLLWLKCPRLSHPPSQLTAALPPTLHSGHVGVYCQQHWGPKQSEVFMYDNLSETITICQEFRKFNFPSRVYQVAGEHVSAVLRQEAAHYGFILIQQP